MNPEINTFLRHLRPSLIIACAHNCGKVTAGDTAAAVLDEAILTGWQEDPDGGGILCPPCAQGERGGTCEECNNPTGEELVASLREIQRRAGPPKGGVGLVDALEDLREFNRQCAEREMKAPAPGPSAADAINGALDLVRALRAEPALTRGADRGWTTSCGRPDHAGRWQSLLWSSSAYFSVFERWAYAFGTQEGAPTVTFAHFSGSKEAPNWQLHLPLVSTFWEQFRVRLNEAAEAPSPIPVGAVGTLAREGGGAITWQSWEAGLEVTMPVECWQRAYLVAEERLGARGADPQLLAGGAS